MLINFSISISRPSNWSCIASANALSNSASRVLEWLSIRTTDRTGLFFLLSLNASVPIKIQRFLTTQTHKISRQLSESLFIQTPHLCLQDLLPTSAYQSYSLFSVLISRQVVKSLTVQAPHSCLQDSLTTSACRDILSCSSPDKLSESSMSKHLACVFRTYSQLQPVEMLPHTDKNRVTRQSMDKSFPLNDLTANLQK